jgi:hypothetical protein
MLEEDEARVRHERERIVMIENRNVKMEKEHSDNEEELKALRTIKD